MPNSLDNAIPQLTAHAVALTTVSVRSAPDYPIENADPLPMVVTHLVSGRVVAANASQMRFFPVVHVDFIFSRANLKEAYQKCDAVAIEYPQRLAGDPTLAGTVSTVFSEPVTFTVTHEQWNTVPVVVLSFELKPKTLETPA